tara:strand:- start:1724 stop:1966 length:243 start_codon:yes stop_codon:yes gene_type:complete
MSVNWAHWAVEITSDCGPTGEFREVLELAVCDYGARDPHAESLWKGTPGEQPEYRIPVQLVATKLGTVVVGADNLADGHV